MRTELIKEDIQDHPGYGAGSGDTVYREFKCPCGKGKIIEEHDNIPGFRDHDVYIDCPICAKEYDLDISKGKCNWQLVRKTL